MSGGPINAQVDTDTGLRYYQFNEHRLVSATSVRKSVGMPNDLHNWVVNQNIDALLNDPTLATLALGKEAKELERRVKHRDGRVETDAEAYLRARRAARAIVRKAADFDRDTAAALGTAVHDAADQGIAATSLTDSDERKAFLLQYERWQVEQKPDILLSEQQVFNLTLGYAGSFDLIADIPNGTSYTRTLIDIKTGKGVYSDHALQLALYMGGEFIGGYDSLEDRDVVYEAATEVFKSCTEMAVLHLRPGMYEMVYIPLTDELAAAAVDMVRFSAFLLKHPDISTLKG